MPTTLAAYQSNLDKHFFPRFGRMKMTSIVASEIQAWVNDASAVGLSARSVVKYLAYLHETFERAVIDQVIPINPCRHTAAAEGDLFGVRLHVPGHPKDNEQREIIVGADLCRAIRERMLANGILFAVTQKAIASALKVIMRADDSSGIIGDACAALLDLHREVAARAKPPVAKLVD